MTTIITPNITSKQKEHAIFFLSGQIKLRCSQLTSGECVDPELRLGRGWGGGWEGVERGEKGLIFLFLYYLKLGSYDLSDDGSLLYFFTRCKSSYILIDKIRLNLGNQGGLWDIKLTPVNMIFIYIWFLQVKITSSVSIYFECSPFLDFFYLDAIFLPHKTGVIMSSK